MRHWYGEDDTVDRCRDAATATVTDAAIAAAVIDAAADAGDAAADVAVTAAPVSI